MPSSRSHHRQPTAWEFNKEIVFGEIGALIGAYTAGFLVPRFSHRPAVISGSLIPATLLGGTVFWLAARIRHQKDRRRWSVGILARDISYFTPAASILGFVVYDPVIVLVSHFLLHRHAPVPLAVAAAQACAFALFLSSMNVYRLILARTVSKRL